MAAALGAGAATFVVGALPWLKAYRARAHSKVMNNAMQHFTRVSTPATLETVVAFLATLHGHPLNVQDHDELIDRVAFASREDAIMDAQYVRLAGFVDGRARTAGAESFSAADETIRNSALDEVMNIRTTTLRARLLSQLSSYEREHYRMRSWTVESLGRLYRRSGVPWRVRGYQRSPGMPGDWKDYTVPGSSRSC